MDSNPIVASEQVKWPNIFFLENIMNSFSIAVKSSFSQDIPSSDVARDVRSEESQRVEDTLLAALDSNLTSLADMVANQQVGYYSNLRDIFIHLKC